MIGSAWNPQLTNTAIPKCILKERKKSPLHIPWNCPVENTLLRTVDMSQMLWEKGLRSSEVSTICAALSKQCAVRKPRPGSGHSTVSPTPKTSQQLPSANRRR